MSTSFTVYDATTGQIISTGTVPDTLTADAQVGAGQAVLYLPSDGGILQYVDLGGPTISAKGSVAASISGSTVVANMVSTIHLTSVSVGANVNITGPNGSNDITVSDGFIDLTFEVPGDFVITVSLEPLLTPLVFNVTATTPLMPSMLFGPSDRGGFWNPAELRTVFQDAAGTTPGVATAVVGLLKDLSPNANAMSQATGADKPILSNSGKQWWLDLDGVNDYLLHASAILQENANWEIMVACRPTGTGTTIYSERDSAGGNPITAIQIGTLVANTANIQVKDDAGHLVQLGDGVSHLSTDCVLGGRIASSNAITISNNGTDIATDSSTTFGATTTTNSAIGCTPVASPTQFFQGRIYAVFVINRILSSGERAGLVTAMGALMGLSL